MEALQARIKLDRFIRIRTGKASIQLSQFLSKIGKDESWLAGIKKGTTCVEPDTFKPALKYLKIKHGSQEYYEFGCYVYTILDDTEKKKFSDMYSKKDVNDMLEKYNKAPKPEPEKKPEPKIEESVQKQTNPYKSFYTDLYKFMNDRINDLGMTWTDVELLIGTRLDRIKNIGQFPSRYLKDILDALSIKHDSEDAKKLVELTKANFKFKAKQDEFDAEYRRILDEDKHQEISEIPVVKETKKEEVKMKGAAEAYTALKEAADKQLKEDHVAVDESFHSKSYAKKDFGRYLSYLIVIKGLSLSSFARIIDSSEDDIKAIIEGRKTFGVFQAMRIPDILELDNTDTREFNQKYLTTQDSNTDIDFPEYVTKYLRNHPSAVLAIAKAADIDADDKVWKNLYTGIVLSQ